MKNNLMLVNIIVAVVVGALAFYGGMQYQMSQRPAFGGGNRQFGGGQGGGRFGQGGGFRPVVGQIISQDATSVTVKLMDGSSKIVLYSGKTSINKQATGTASDLKTGETVAAFGTQNSDGSVTATNIQLNPMMRFGGRPSGAPAQ